MKSETKRKLRKYLSAEISIEYKACLYFSCIVFFYSACLLVQKNYFASVAVLWEMVLTAYAMGYLQVYLFRNFDEADRLGKREAASILLCACLYTGVSWLFKWFDRSAPATLLYLAYMLLCYGCIFLCNKVKRMIDTQNLNKLLTEFKKEGKHE
ncbi:MAG: DUF3021 domain-containing protein [Eubacteriales bacterium]|nr:DUF3021 domain-containing protein [Eubacteriales bacterium]